MDVHSPETRVTHTISFRRPELRHVLSAMSVPPEADVAAQIHRLQSLGYQIVDVSPPLKGNSYSSTAELRMVRKAATSSPGERLR
jgi:hypothetical protein